MASPPRPDPQPAPPPATSGGRARRWLTDPLLHFIVAGAVLAGASALYQRGQDVYRIVITPAHVAQLARKHQLQYGAPPDAATLDQLVADDVHDEILFREGLQQGLDRGDEIVRRRVVQKEEFLLQNTRAPAEPNAAQVQAFYAAHADRYAVPPRASFSHVYFALGGAGGPAADTAAQARAQAALAQLPPTTTRAPDKGDPFPDLYDFAAFEAPQVERLFGRTPFARAVFTAPVGRWSGPYRSAYGWHLLRVEARTPARRPPLAEVEDRVRADATQDAQDRANAQAFERTARRFTVVRADRQARR